MGTKKLTCLLWTLLLLQLTTARTVIRAAEGAADADAEGFQSFTRDGMTVRMKPRSQTIHIGGQNIPNERMIEQAALMKDLEPVAVRQLLETRQPVTRTTFVDGIKRTSTYSLESDGSIKCKIVSDIDPKEVDATFEQIAQRRQQQQPSVAHETKEVHTESVANPQTVHTRNNFDSAPASTYPRLPTVWNPDQWPKHDPFNPQELPELGQRTQVAPLGELDTQTPSRTLHRTYNSQWTRPSPAQDSFWKSSYETTTAVPTRVIDINDLPMMTVLNSGQPVDEHFLRNHPAELLPPGGDRPLKTLKIDNIPQSPDVETTKVKSITRTLTSDHIPTQSELDPSMQEILRRAGINPADADGAENNTITRVRVEPDGRVVKTTYRVRKLPATPVFNFDTNRGLGSAPAPSGLDSEWLKPFSRTPGNSYSGSQQGVNFPSYAPSSTTPAQIFGEDEGIDSAKTLNPWHMHSIDGDAAAGEEPSAIEEYLKQVGLRVADIEARDGEYSKTIVDKDGRTMRVKFVLSPRMYG